jgi:hypothetical protein
MVSVEAVHHVVATLAHLEEVKQVCCTAAAIAIAVLSPTAAWSMRENKGASSSAGQQRVLLSHFGHLHCLLK